jgi:hypothetical protein
VEERTPVAQSTNQQQIQEETHAITEIADPDQRRSADHRRVRRNTGEHAVADGASGGVQWPRRQ